MNDQKAVVVKLKELLGGEGRSKLIVVVGLLAMGLILLSQFMPKKSSTVSTEEAFSSVAYVEQLEKKLTGTIGSIEGVGKVQVMVTLDSTAQTVFATEENRRTDLVQDTGTDARTKVQESDNTQVNYILVDQGGGRREALVSTTLEPTVKGVVVVCSGGENKLISVRVTEVVTTALGIGANKVCVVKGGD